MNDLLLEDPCALAGIWPRFISQKSDDRLFPRSTNPSAVRLATGVNPIRIMVPGNMAGNLMVWYLENFDELRHDALARGEIYETEFHLDKSSDILPFFSMHVQRSAERIIRDAWVRIHKVPEQQSDDASSLLRRLDEIQDSETLTQLLRDLATGKAKLPAGLPADSPAISVVKRLLAIDFDRAIHELGNLMRPHGNLSFRAGYFQISLAGALLALVRASSPNQGLAVWIWSETDKLRGHGLKEFADRSLAFALIAALTAVGLVAESSDYEGLKRIEHEIATSLGATSNPQERRAFLRFLADSCNQGIDSSNLYFNFAKLVVFLRHIVDDPEILRTQNQLLCGVRDLLQPVKELLSK